MHHTLADARPQASDEEGDAALERAHGVARPAELVVALLKEKAARSLLGSDRGIASGVACCCCGVGIGLVVVRSPSLRQAVRIRQQSLKVLSHDVQLCLEDAELHDIHDDGDAAQHQRAVPASAACEDVDKAGKLEDEPEVACDIGDAVVLRWGGRICRLCTGLTFVAVLDNVLNDALS
jgi:hypothetical protein